MSHKDNNVPGEKLFPVYEGRDCITREEGSALSPATTKRKPKSAYHALQTATSGREQEQNHNYGSLELQTVTGLTALELWILFGHLGVAAGTGMVAVQPMHGKKVTLPRAIGYVCLGVTYGTGHINLAIFRHIMMTGSTSKTLMHLMGKSDVHPFALCILDNARVFHNLTNFPQRSGLGPRSHGGYQASGKQQA